MKNILNIEIWHKPPNRDNESKLINQESEIKISTNCFPCFCFQLNYSYKEQFIGVIINLYRGLYSARYNTTRRVGTLDITYYNINGKYGLVSYFTKNAMSTTLLASWMLNRIVYILCFMYNVQCTYKNWLGWLRSLDLLRHWCRYSRVLHISPSLSDVRLQ